MKKRLRVLLLTTAVLVLALATGWSPPRWATDAPTAVLKAGTDGGICLAAPGCNREPYCSDGCAPWKPCDKVCRDENENCITCGDTGNCDGGPPPPPPPPPPPQEDCTDPVISAVPNPVHDGDNNGQAVVRLFVSNSSNDLLNFAFTWNFGDGTFNTTTLTGFTKGFAVGCHETREYMVYWEGWARCDDGTDLFKTDVQVVTVFGACVAGGGGGEDPGDPDF